MTAASYPPPPAPEFKTSAGTSSSSLGRVLIVLIKEVRDHMRDRRSLGLALVYPLLGPLLIGLMLGAALETMRGGTQQAIPLVLRQAGDAPELVAFLKENDVALRIIPFDSKVKISSRWPLLLDVIPENSTPFPRVKLQLYYDTTSMNGISQAGALAEVLAKWLRQTSDQRIHTLGLDPRDLTPVYLERIPLGSRVSPASFFFRLIPPLMIFMIFLGAVYLTVDTTVGERERGTLEPLLTAPILRWELLLGKACAALIFTVLTVAINATGFWVILNSLSMNHPGFDPPSSDVFLRLFLFAMPLMVLAVSLQFAIAVMSRGIKEAQIYLGLLPLIPALPGMAGAISPVAPEPWMAVVPVLGQMIQFTRIVNGEAVDVGAITIATFATLVVSVAIFRAAAVLFDRERNLTPG